MIYYGKSRCVMNTLLLCPGQSSARRKDNTKATPVVCNTNAKVQYQSITGAQFFCTKIQKYKTSATPQYSEYQSVQCSAVQMYLFCSYLWPAFLCKAIQYEWEHNIAFQFVCWNCTGLKCILVHCNVHCTLYTIHCSVQCTSYSFSLSMGTLLHSDLGLGRLFACPLFCRFHHHDYE